jgi:MraZ protein
VVFTGQSDHLIDAKGRLAIPAKYRKEEWGTGLPGSAWYCIPWPTGHLRLYTEATFTRLASMESGSLTPDEDVAELERLLYGSAERLESDAQGRVILPRTHQDETRIGTEVTVVGARDRIEVHGRAAWTAAMEQRKTQMAAVLARMSARKPE